MNIYYKNPAGHSSCAQLADSKRAVMYKNMQMQQSIAEDGPRGPENLVTSSPPEELRRLIGAGKISIKKWRDNVTCQTLIHVAAQSGQANSLEVLLSASHSVTLNAQDLDGNTALHTSVFNCHREASILLLTGGINDELVNKTLDPALHVAFRRYTPKMLPLIKAFIEHPNVDILVEGRHKWNSLQVLTDLGNYELLVMLHEKLMKISDNMSHLLVRDNNGANLMHMAARAGASKILRFLFSVCHSCEDLMQAVAADDKMPIHYAVEGGHTECVQMLLSHGADCAVLIGNRTPPIHRVCIKCDMDMLKMIVEVVGPDILHAHDKEGGTLLHSCAASTCSKEMVVYLVQNGIGVNDTDNVGFTPLANAILLGNANAVENLLEIGADPLIADKNGCNALHLCVKGRRRDIFNKVISSEKAKLMAARPDRKGFEPLQLALKVGWIEVIDSLLPLGDSYTKDKDGNNLIHYAALSTNDKVILRILHYPFGLSMINETNHSSLTPLHLAASKTNPNVAQVLIEHGAVLQRSKTGLTPFMCACSNGNFETARTLLLVDKFQKNWVDRDGNSSLHLAVDGGNANILKLCLDEGTFIVLNNNGQSFFDKILDMQRQTLAEVVLQHPRWEECLDITSLDKPHPIVRILDDIPEVYGILLDQCYSTSNHNPKHRDYWEEFNFKSVIISPMNTNVVASRRKDNDGDGGAEFSLQRMHGGSVTERKMRETRHDTVIDMQLRSTQCSCFPNRDTRPLAILRKLVESNHQTYLLHPVIAAFIRTRWNGFSANYYLFKLLMHFLLALLLTVFLTHLPTSELPLVLKGNDTDYHYQLSKGQTSFACIIIVISFLNLFFFVEEITHRCHLLVQTFFEGIVGMNFVASILTIIYMSSVLAEQPVAIWWGVATSAVCFTWLTVGFNLQLINLGNIGVYITIIINTTRLILTVLVLVFFLVLAFGIPMYLLLGYERNLQYTSVGLALFSIINDLIAVTDYYTFVKLEQNGVLLFPTMVFLFLVVMLILLPIVTANVLIGLAVGNIKKIQKNAVISRREVEVRALSHTDNLFCLQRCIRNFTTLHYRRYPNRIKNLWHWISDHLFQFQGDKLYAEELKVMSRAVTKIVAKQGEKQETRILKLGKSLEEIAATQVESLERLMKLESTLRNRLK